MAISFSRFRWPLVGLLSMAALGLIFQEPGSALRSVLIGGASGLVLSFAILAIRRARAQKCLSCSEALWFQGLPATDLAEALTPYRFLVGEMGYRIANLLGQAHLALGWRQTAWLDYLEGQIARAPWWTRKRVAAFLSNLPQQPTTADLQRGQQLMEACPGLPRLPHALGILHLRLHQPEEAWSCFRRCVSAAAEDPLLLEDLFQASLASQEYRDVTERALTLLCQRHGDPRLGWDRGAAGHYLIERGRFAEVVALLQPLPREQRTTPWHWAALVLALHSLGEVDGAWSEVEEGLQQHPTAFRLWMERFQLALDAKDDLSAENSLLEAARCLPEDSSDESLRWELNLRNAEFAYWARGDADAAKLFLDQVPAHLRTTGHPPLSLSVLIATGEFEAAQRVLQPLLQRHPDDLDLLLMQADVLAGMEAWKALLPYLEQLPAEARNHPGFWHLRGLALVNLGDAFHSRMDLERAAHMEPTTLRYVLDAGHGCAELGEWERSEAHWRQALRLEPTLEEALVQLAEARRSLHDLPGARQLLRECLTHHPSSEEAQGRLAELEAN